MNCLAISLLSTGFTLSNTVNIFYSVDATLSYFCSNT
jgi:hypothetical protein